jgi:transcription elongation factor GreA
MKVFMDDFFPMTVHGKSLLDKELDRLIKVDREELKKSIAEARALGDLKENSEYQSAKEKQSIIEGRIKDLQHKISKAKIIDVTNLKGSKIIFGATVTLSDIEKDKILTYQIVGEDESDLKSGKISFSSPVARALIGKEEGDTALVKAPKGDIEYEILKVEYK